MKRKKSRVVRVDGNGPAGDGAAHGPDERTARDEAAGFATASDVERAEGADAASPTARPAPPPREDENAAAERESTAEEFLGEDHAGMQDRA